MSEEKIITNADILFEHMEEVERLEERISALEKDLEQITSEHESLLAFARSEIGKLPPVYVKHKAGYGGGG